MVWQPDVRQMALEEALRTYLRLPQVVFNGNGKKLIGNGSTIASQ